MTREPLTEDEAQSVCSDAVSFGSAVTWVRARAAGSVEGIFGPGSALWALLREPAVAIGGVRAVLLQIAHPAVAAAGARSSNFQRDFIGRARRTFSSMYELMFGDLTTALRSARRIHVLHARVRGVIDATASSFLAGQGYHAADPDLLFWVLATLIDSTLHAFKTFLDPVPLDEQARFYEDMKVLGVLLGIPEGHMPPSLDAFRRYFDDMIAGPTLEVGPTASALAHFLFTEGWSVGQLDEIHAAGLLPERFIAAYRLPWTARERRASRGLAGSLRGLFRAMPAELRYVPAYHQAMLRVAIAGGHRASTVARTVNALQRFVSLPLSLHPVRDPDDPLLALYPLILGDRAARSPR